MSDLVLTMIWIQRNLFSFPILRSKYVEHGNVMIMNNTNPIKISILINVGNDTLVTPIFKIKYNTDPI